MNPYTDNSNIRTFAEDVDPMSLIWHEDQEDRTIEVIEGNGWKFQYDDSLPFELKQGDQFFIERMTYHRLLKGTTQLRVLIEKHYG